MEEKVLSILHAIDAPNNPDLVEDCHRLPSNGPSPPKEKLYLN